MGSVRGVLVGGMSDIFRAIDLFCNFLTWAKIWMVIKVAHHCTFKSHQLVAVMKLYNTNKTMTTLIKHSYDNDLNPPDRTFWFWSPQGTSRSHSNATQQSHLLCRRFVVCIQRCRPRTPLQTYEDRGHQPIHNHNRTAKRVQSKSVSMAMKTKT